MANKNSLEALRKQGLKIERDKDRILNFLRDGRGGDGQAFGTCEYIEQQLGMLHQTASARIFDLMREQKIKISHNLKDRAVYTIRKNTDPLNKFERTNREKLEYLETLLSIEQRKLYNRFLKG